MNRLKKSAWTDLIVATISVAIACLVFSLMTHFKAKGIYLALVFVFTVCLTGLFTYLRFITKGVEMGFDEREKLIYRESFSWAARVLVVFLGCSCILPFFLFGGQKLIPLWILPMLYFCAMFIAQFVHSSLILVKCALENKNGV